MHVKVEKLLYVSHFMIEFAMSRVLERFWTRTALFTRGIFKLPSAINPTGATPGITGGGGGSGSDGYAAAVTRYWTIKEGENSPPFNGFGAIAGREREREG